MSNVIDLNADPTATAARIARFLKARGVDRIFGLQGGHIQPIWDHVARQGIRIVDVRHEAAGVGKGAKRRAHWGRQRWARFALPTLPLRRPSDILL